MFLFVTLMWTDTFFWAVYSENDISWHLPLHFISQQGWLTSKPNYLQQHIRFKNYRAVKLGVFNQSLIFWKAKDGKKWPVWMLFYFPIFILNVSSLWPSTRTSSAWGYYSDQLSKMKILLFISCVVFYFPLSAYSEEDRFTEAVVSMEEITTSPASFPGGVNSLQVKIVPTEKIPAAISARTKEKGK